MYTILKTLHSPTIIENCISCHFSSLYYKDIVLSGSNLLHIYNIIHDSSNDNYNINKIGSYSFLENISCLRYIYLSDIKSHVLIIGFKDARFSIIQFDSSSYNLKTISLHNFETDDFKGGYYTCVTLPRLSSDPLSQCATMSFFNYYFAILPLSNIYGTSTLDENHEYTELFGDNVKFKSENTLNDNIKDVIDKSCFHLPSSIIINVKQVVAKLTNILDFSFLHGYYEPTLLILYEPFQTWAGKVTTRQESVCMIALSINLYQRVYPIIWSMSDLPYDCLRAVPVPKPLGGVLILATNSLLYLNQRKSVPIWTRALNKLAPSSLTNGIPSYSSNPVDHDTLSLKLQHDSCHAVFYEPYKVVVAASEGYFFVIDMRERSANHTIHHRINMVMTDVKPIASDMCFCGPGLIFIASHISDSFLLKVKNDLSSDSSAHDKDNMNNHPIDGTHNNIYNGDAKRIKLTTGNDDANPTHANHFSYRFQICDNIINVGPCSHSSLGQPIINGEDFVGDGQKEESHTYNDPDLELIVTSGKEETGALTLMQRSIIPQLITTFHLPGIINLWTLNSVSLEFDAYPDEFDHLNELPNKLKKDQNYNSFLLLSMKESSLILKTGLEITELESSGFNTHAQTLIAGNFNVLNTNGQKVCYIVQVTPFDARLLLGDILIQNLSFDALQIPGSPIVSAYICDPYILLLGESSQLTLLTLNHRTIEVSEHPCLQVINESASKVYQKPPIIALCLHRDHSDIFLYHDKPETYMNDASQNKDILSKTQANTDKSKNNMAASNAEPSKKYAKTADKSVHEAKKLSSLPRIKIEKDLEPKPKVNEEYMDEDELLYGTKLVPEEITKGSEIKKEQIREDFLINDLQDDIFNDESNLKSFVECYNTTSKQKPYQNPTFWALVSRMNGQLEIYSVPSFVLRYHIHNFHLKMDILSDEDLFNRETRANKYEELSRKRGKRGDRQLQSDDDTKQNLLDSYLVREISVVNIKYKRPVVSQKSEGYPLNEEDDWSNPNSEESYTTIVKPYLLALINETLVIYQIYPYPNPNNNSKNGVTINARDDGHLEMGKHDSISNILINSDIRQLSKRLNLRFRKIEHNMLLGERKAAKSLPKKDAFYRLSNVLRSTPSIRNYDNINSTQGIFIQGLLPQWIIPGQHGDLKIHPMAIDGPIYAFTPFHNVNCHRGFLYFNHKDELRVCLLPTHLKYDQDWLTRKIPIGATVHFVEFHIKMKVYVLITSRRTRATRLVKHLASNYRDQRPLMLDDGLLHPEMDQQQLTTEDFLSGEEKEIEDIDSDPYFPAPPLDEFSVDLVCPGSWEMVPSARLDIDSEWERITSFKQVSLISQGSITGFKDFLVVGTSCVYGEDMTCRGRLFILDIIEVVPEPGQPLTKYKIKVVCSNEQKGPVLALAAISGNLVTVIGQKIYIWALNKSDDLVGLAFIDTSFCVHTIAIVKNLIIIGDLHKSVTFLRYDTDTKSISIASREYSHLSVYGIQFIVDNEKLGFIASDRQKNIAIFAYQPQVRESYGGQKLVRKGDINVGTFISSFFRIFCKRKDPMSDKKPSLALERRQATFFVGLDGRIGYLLPISEKLYRRLLMVQSFLDSNTFYRAGLNPKLARGFQFSRQQLVNPAKSILDGNLLFQFLHMNALQQELVVKNVGVSLDQIIDDFLEIDRTTSHL